MGTLAGSPPTDKAEACNLNSLPIDDQRGIQGMLCVILTEMSLFVCLFQCLFLPWHRQESLGCGSAAQAHVRTRHGGCAA